MKDSLYKYKDPTLPIAVRVEDLIDRMTVQELVAQTISVGRATLLPDAKQQKEVLDSGKICNPELIELLKFGMGSFQLPGRELTPRDSARYRNILQKHLLENTRLGIPALSQEEGLNGHLAKGATMFPKPIAMASSFDPDLVKQVYSAIGKEIRARGGHQVFTPVLDLGRDPRWGRFEETYGEDTYLTTQLAKAAVRGLQGDICGVADDHVIASPKHFAGYGQCDGGRNFAPEHITTRQLFDEILPPFEAAVREAGALGIMPSHAEIDGVPCHGNPWLLQEILRKQWGFQGIVVSDYDDVLRLHILHKVQDSKKAAAVAGLFAGVDMDVPVGSAFTALVEAATENEAVLATLKTAVRRILTLKFRLGLFETPYVDPEEAQAVTNCAEHQEIARKIAEESVVLIKNQDGILPLQPEQIKTIAVIGPNAHPVEFGGYSSRPNIGISVLDGVRDAFPTAEILYEPGCRITKTSSAIETEMDMELSNPELSPLEEEAQAIEQAVAAARKADVVILCVGGTPNTSREAVTLEKHYGDNANLDLLGCQNLLIEKLAETGTKIITIILGGKPVSGDCVYENSSAVLQGWYLGQETGRALADILLGNTAPSGRLPVTVVRNAGHLPGYYSQKATGFLKEYLFEKEGPRFCFGYGLSYTTFRYDNLRLEKDTIRLGESTTVLIDVTNTGKRPGVETVQLYLSDQIACVTRPVEELKGFARVCLAPGQTKTVALTITPEDLSFTGLDYKKIQEAGTTLVRVGPNCMEWSQTILTVVE